MVTNNRLVRYFSHLQIGSWHLATKLGPDARMKITAAVQAAEAGHAGEIRVVLEGRLRLTRILQGVGARERALEVFAEDHVWDTETNSGVLLFVLLGDKDAEIVADRGYNGRISAEEWRSVCVTLEEQARNDELVEGLCDAISRIGDLLRRAFPAISGENELPDDVVVR